MHRSSKPIIDKGSYNNMEHAFRDDMSYWAEVPSGGVYGQGEGIRHVKALLRPKL